MFSIFITGACLVFISSVSSFILDVPSAENLLIFTDQTKDIHAGSEVRLQCVVNLSSNTKVKWASTLGCLPDNAHTENHNMTLVIKNFRSSDTGKYICVVTHGTKQTSHVFIVQSNRILPPTSLPDVQSAENLLIFTDQTKDIHAGSEVRLQCVVNLSSNTKVKWASTLGCLPDNVHTENYNMTLVIKHFRSSDTGEYICVATNGAKHTSHVFIVQSNRISSPTSLPAAVGPICLNCRDALRPDECNQVTYCDYNEKCGMSVFLRKGQVWYDLGCKSNVECATYTITGKRELTFHPDTGRLENDTRSIICDGCCDQDICNFGGMCGTREPQTFGGRFCFGCDQQSTKNGCDRVKLCYQDRQCYIHQKKIPTSFKYIWETGCAVTPENCTKTPGTICSQCCKGTLCNNDCTTIPITLRPTTPTPPTTQPPATTPRPSTPTKTQAPRRKPNIDHIDIDPSLFHHGDTVRIHCHVSGNPQPTVGWNMMVDPTHIPANLKIQAESYGSTIIITNYAAENDASYQCFANNKWGDAVGNATLQAVV